MPPRSRAAQHGRLPALGGVGRAIPKRAPGRGVAPRDGLRAREPHVHTARTLEYFHGHALHVACGLDAPQSRAVGLDVAGAVEVRAISWLRDLEAVTAPDR